MGDCFNYIRRRERIDSPPGVSINKKRRFIAPGGRYMNPAAGTPPDNLAKND
jgi:hypothetical protein